MTRAVHARVPHCFLVVFPVQAPREKKDLYVHIPVLDHAFTLAFAALVVFVAHTVVEEEPQEGRLPSWLVLLVMIVGVAVVVAATKALSTWLAGVLNVSLVAAHLVHKPPIVGKAQMKKWQDQFWQFVVHVSMTAFEVYVLSTELGGLWTDMSTAWVPDPRTWKMTPLTRLLYLVQLVGIGKIQVQGVRVERGGSTGWLGQMQALA
jgi:hypothetical protein